MKVYLATQVQILHIAVSNVVLAACVSHTLLHFQVLSTSVAKALEYFNDQATVETQRFCKIFDRFF